MRGKRPKGQKDKKGHGGKEETVSYFLSYTRSGVKYSCHLSVSLSIIYLYLSSYLSIYLSLFLSPSLLKVGDINTEDTVWEMKRAASW